MEINKIYCGDCLPILKTFDDCSVDAVITDPPYSSGGATMAERQKDPGNIEVAHRRLLDAI